MTEVANNTKSAPRFLATKEESKIHEVEQAGSEIAKALSQNVAFCCAYIQKNDSDRHCNVAGDVHLLGMKPTFFLNCGQSKIMWSTLHCIADRAASDRGSGDK